MSDVNESKSGFSKEHLKELNDLGIKYTEKKGYIAVKSTDDAEDVADALAGIDDVTIDGKNVYINESLTSKYKGKANQQKIVFAKGNIITFKSDKGKRSSIYLPKCEGISAERYLNENNKIVVTKTSIKEKLMTYEQCEVFRKMITKQLNARKALWGFVHDKRPLILTGSKHLARLIKMILHENGHTARIYAYQGSYQVAFDVDGDGKVDAEVEDGVVVESKYSDDEKRKAIMGIREWEGFEPYSDPSIWHETSGTNADGEVTG